MEFKASFFFPPFHPQLSFSPCPSLSWSFPMPSRCTQGNRIFYCTGKALSVPHEGRLGGGISSAIQATEGRPDHVIYYTRAHTGSIQTRTPNSPSYRVDAANITLASLSQLKPSHERDDKMLASVSPTLSRGPREERPLSRAQGKQTQACTKACHKPQPTSRFPLSFFFFSFSFFSLP